MNPNQIDLKKTGVLFFDLLNGYYHEASESAKLRKKPMVENARLLMRCARAAGLRFSLPTATTDPILQRQRSH